MMQKTYQFVIFKLIIRHGNSTPNGGYTPKWDFLYSEIVMSTPFSRNCDQRRHSQTILSSNVYNLSSIRSFLTRFSAVVSSFQSLSTQSIHYCVNMSIVMKISPYLLARLLPKKNRKTGVVDQVQTSIT